MSHSVIESLKPIALLVLMIQYPMIDNDSIFAMSIRQITIIGTGLIGGSLGLALRKRVSQGHIVGCDQPDVLRLASENRGDRRRDSRSSRSLRGSNW